MRTSLAFFAFFFGLTLWPAMDGESFAGTGLFWPYYVLLPSYLAFAVAAWRGLPAENKSHPQRTMRKKASE